PEDPGAFRDLDPGRARQRAPAHRRAAAGRAFRHRRARRRRRRQAERASVVPQLVRQGQRRRPLHRSRLCRVFALAKVLTMTDRKAVLSWALYDWANSAFALAVVSVFFPVLLKQYWSADVDAVTS